MNDQYHWRKQLDQAEARLTKERLKPNVHPLAIEAGEQSIAYCQQQLDNAIALAKKIAKAKAEREAS